MHGNAEVICCTFLISNITYIPRSNIYMKRHNTCGPLREFWLNDSYHLSCDMQECHDKLCFTLGGRLPSPKYTKLTQLLHNFIKDNSCFNHHRYLVIDIIIYVICHWLSTPMHCSKYTYERFFLCQIVLWCLAHNKYLIQH